MRRHQHGARAVSNSLARAAFAAATGIGALMVFLVVAPVEARAAGIVPPANPAADIPPQVLPHCTPTPVDDTSAGCIDSVLHNINYARSLEGLGSMVLPSDYANDSVPLQQLIIADEERGDRGLSQFAGLDPALDAAALTGAQDHDDPSAPIGLPGHRVGCEFRPGRHATRSRLRLDVQRRVRRHQHHMHVAERPLVLGPPGQHPRALGDDGQHDSPDGRRRHEQRPVHPDLHEPG